MIARIDNRAEIKQMLKTWLGGVDLTAELEEDPIYRPLLMGAAALMCHEAFDWSCSAADTWIDKARQAPGIYYGIRFSATQPLMITFGWITKIYQFGQLKSTARYARFQYSNHRFVPELHPSKRYTFNQVLRKLVDVSKCRFCYSDIEPIALNKFKASSQAIAALNNYLNRMKQKKGSDSEDEPQLAERRQQEHDHPPNQSSTHPLPYGVTSNTIASPCHGNGRRAHR